MRETAKQSKMATCSHYKATLQKPGYQTNYKTGLVAGKYKCPNCGLWWIEETELNNI